MLVIARLPAPPIPFSSPSEATNTQLCISTSVLTIEVELAKVLVLAVPKLGAPLVHIIRALCIRIVTLDVA